MSWHIRLVPKADIEPSILPLDQSDLDLLADNKNEGLFKATLPEMSILVLSGSVQGAPPGHHRYGRPNENDGGVTVSSVLTVPGPG